MDVSEIRAEIRNFWQTRGKCDASAAGQQRIVELIETLIDQQHR